MPDFALRVLSELAILAVAGIFAALVRAWLGEVRAVTVSVEKVAELVRQHGESLAAGNQRFKALDAELTRVAKGFDTIEREGCAYRRACTTTKGGPT